jgi:hypothetical protein
MLDFGYSLKSSTVNITCCFLLFFCQKICYSKAGNANLLVPGCQIFIKSYLLIRNGTSLPCCASTTWWIYLCLLIFPFTTASRLTLGPTQPPIQWVPAALSMEVKRPQREANHPPPCSAEVNNAWSYTSAPQYAFMVWRSVKKSTGTTLPFTSYCIVLGKKVKLKLSLCLNKYYAIKTYPLLN